MYAEISAWPLAAEQVNLSQTVQKVEIEIKKVEYWDLID